MTQELIKKAWEKYIVHHEEIPQHVKGVKDEILRSWQRSLQYLDYTKQETKHISKSELHLRIEKNMLLLQIAYPYLLNFIEDLGEDNFIIMLTDADGCMLKLITKGEVLTSMIEENKFKEGYFFNEKECGTGGVGLCLVEKKPVIVYGYEHYNQYYHNLVCYGAPLEDLTGQIIGSISITGSINAYQPVIMGMVKAAKNGIERELALTNMNETLNTTINSIHSGIIVLNMNNDILFHNFVAIDLLELFQNHIVNKPISDILNQDTLIELDNFNKTFENKIILIHTLENKQIYLNISVKINPSSATKLIIFESQSERNRLSSFLAGFKANRMLNELKGISPIMKQLRELAYSLSQLDTPILIIGENGTEYNIVAQGIHNESQRKDYPFVTIDCTSSLSSLDHEIFGDENNLGKICLAENGTLFIKEINALPLKLQDKLYQFLLEKKLKIGHQYLYHFNVRIIAYASCHLDELVEKGLFHKQLYYLLNLISLTIPPLRERKEDIGTLVQYFSLRYSKSIKQEQVSFDNDCLNAFHQYDWPGNVQQLQNVIESAIFSTHDSIIQLSQLPLDIINEYYHYIPKKTLNDFNQERNDQFLVKEVQEYNELIFALTQSKGDVKKASELIYIPLSTFYRKLKKHHIDPKKYKRV